MEHPFLRTEMLIGTDALNKLSNLTVAVFGLGGVGGYALEALARSGVGCFYLFDNDTISISNINRQIIATTKTIGMQKVDAAKQRILDINPTATVITNNIFLLPENSNTINFEEFDYIIDAIDTVTAKIELAVIANKLDIPIISSMGTGNKLNANFKVTDIYKTKNCPLARVMRKELKVRNIESLKVVYSDEAPLTPLFNNENCDLRRQTPASIAYVPSVAGLIIAGEVIKDTIST